MDVLVKLTVSNCIYRFYSNASQHVANSTPEDVMSDALSAYAGLLSNEIAKEREKAFPDSMKETQLPRKDR